MKTKTRVERYLPLARSVARYFTQNRRGGTYLEYQDFLSACYEGLCIADQICDDDNFVYEARRQMANCANRMRDKEGFALSRHAMKAHGSVSIDATPGGSDGLGIHTKDDKAINLIIIKADMENGLKTLDARRKGMFMDYYFGGMNTRDVGIKYGITHQAVSNNLKRIMRLLHNEKALTK